LKEGYIIKNALQKKGGEKVEVCCEGKWNESLGFQKLRKGPREMDQDVQRVVRDGLRSGGKEGGGACGAKA